MDTRTVTEARTRPRVWSTRVSTGRYSVSLTGSVSTEVTSVMERTSARTGLTRPTVTRRLSHCPAASLSPMRQYIRQICALINSLCAKMKHKNVFRRIRFETDPIILQNNRKFFAKQLTVYFDSSRQTHQN